MGGYVAKNLKAIYYYTAATTNHFAFSFRSKQAVASLKKKIKLIWMHDCETLITRVMTCLLGTIFIIETVLEAL